MGADAGGAEGACAGSGCAAVKSIRMSSRTKQDRWGARRPMKTCITKNFSRLRTLPAFRNGFNSHSLIPDLNLVRSASKNGSSERSAGHSAVVHQRDRIDVRRIVRGKEEHRLGQIFWLAQRPSGRITRMVAIETIS